MFENLTPRPLDEGIEETEVFHLYFMKWRQPPDINVLPGDNNIVDNYLKNSMAN